MKALCTLIIISVLLSPFLNARIYNTARSKKQPKRDNQIVNQAIDKKEYEYVDATSGWKSLLDPKTDMFWSEGGHKPDAGFLLFAKHPTIDNAKKWLLRMEMKARIVQKLNGLVVRAQQELVLEGKMIDRYQMVKGQNENQKNVFSKAEEAKIALFDLFFLFSPSCVHCQGLAKTLKGLKTVKPLQVGGGKPFHFKGLAKSVFASVSTIESYVPGGKVPVLILLDGKKNKMVRLTGNKNKESILQAVKQLERMEG